ncbi:MAG: NADH:ubiquinone reductase (Na(+)-transporting) subunit D [Porticoccaceae bacterium]|jgi:Na+-transporting NADH:ubiquinone oxidoreductase subunit D
MAEASWKQVLVGPLITNNPIMVQVLGICSALAVTTKMGPTLVMCIGLTLVAAVCSFFVSLLRHQIPSSIRIIVQVTIAATAVILVDQTLKAFAYELSKELSVFVGLILTNCIVLGRMEGFAMQNRPIPSLLDGIGNGLGYSLLLLTVGTIREIFGSGTWFGFEVMPLASNGGWYESNGMMLLAPSAFFIVGLLMWALRSWKTSLMESPEYKIAPNSRVQEAF